MVQIRKMTIQSLPSICRPSISLFHFISFDSHYPLIPAISPPTRRALSFSALISTAISTFPSSSFAAPSKSAAPDFFDLPDSAGVKALELRTGSGETPIDGDQVISFQNPLEIPFFLAFGFISNEVISLYKG